MLYDFVRSLQELEWKTKGVLNSEDMFNLLEYSKIFKEVKYPYDHRYEALHILQRNGYLYLLMLDHEDKRCIFFRKNTEEKKKYYHTTRRKYLDYLLFANGGDALLKINPEKGSEL